MKLIYERTFLKDLKAIRDKPLKAAIEEMQNINYVTNPIKDWKVAKRRQEQMGSLFGIP